MIGQVRLLIFEQKMIMKSYGIFKAFILYTVEPLPLPLAIECEVVLAPVKS